MEEIALMALPRENGGESDDDEVETGSESSHAPELKASGSKSGGDSQIWFCV